MCTNFRRNESQKVFRLGCKEANNREGYEDLGILGRSSAAKTEVGILGRNPR